MIGSWRCKSQVTFVNDAIRKEPSVRSILHKVRDILLFGWSENFGHQGPEHGNIDNCKKLANCTNNKDVYLTVLRAHAREGHLQYLRSLEADLADAEQDEGDDAGESVPASSIDKEVKLVLVSWGSDTRHCNHYTLGS
jgi:hypothetical protein